MKFRKINVVVVLATVFLLSACGNNNAKKDADISVKKAQDISFMSDINENKERVWLGVHRDSDTEFNKNSVVYTAMRIKDKKIEVVDVSKEIKELDNIKDDKLWEYLVKENQSNFEKEKEKRIETIDSDIESTNEILKQYQNGYKVDGVPKSEREKVIKDNEVLKEKILKIKKIVPDELKATAKISTDATGNQVISEDLFLENAVNEKLLAVNSLADGEYTYIPTSVSTILSKNYVGYSGKDGVLITRKTDDIKNVKFDTTKEKNVKEYAN